MTAEGAIFYIIILCLVLPLAGFGAELLICRIKNEKIKIALNIGGLLICLIRGFAEKDFYTGAAVIFGAAIGWAVNYLIKNRK